MKKKVVIPAIFLIFTVFTGYLYWGFKYATDNTVTASLKKYPQNALAYHIRYRDANLGLEKTLKRKFLDHYFSPWKGKLPDKANLDKESLSDIKQDFKDQFHKLSDNPGMGANMHTYNKEWVKSLKANADFQNFPRLNANAISIKNTNIRGMPTLDPSYTNVKQEGNAYPFDNLQTSFIPVGTPLHVIHVSKDGNWYLVTTSSYYGWVAQQDIGFVSPSFIKSWTTGTYAVALKDGAQGFVHNRKELVTRIGVLYPVKKINQSTYQILTVEANNHKAVIEPAYISKKYLTLFPLTASSKNIAKIANNLLGKPYGWGGMYGYRDCSSTQMDLMTTFGVWLPRNSSAQFRTGKFISFNGLSNKDKEQVIAKKGVPLFTLIHFPGHIALYVGEKNGHAYMLHNMWGLHTYKLNGSEGRAVVGKTVITPVNFGEDFSNVTKSLLSKADGITTLVSVSK